MGVPVGEPVQELALEALGEIGAFRNTSTQDDNDPGKLVSVRISRAAIYSQNF
jgi:hypothetical protein